MSSAEKERETQVYMAKLAEQAERYDGTLHHFVLLLPCFSDFCCIVIFLPLRCDFMMILSMICCFVSDYDLCWQVWTTGGC